MISLLGPSLVGGLLFFSPGVPCRAPAPWLSGDRANGTPNFRPPREGRPSFRAPPYPLRPRGDPSEAPPPRATAERADHDPGHRASGGDQHDTLDQEAAPECRGRVGQARDRGGHHRQRDRERGGREEPAREPVPAAHPLRGAQPLTRALGRGPARRILHPVFPATIRSPSPTCTCLRPRPPAR